MLVKQGGQACRRLPTPPLHLPAAGSRDALSSMAKLFPGVRAIDEHTSLVDDLAEKQGRVLADVRKRRDIHGDACVTFEATSEQGTRCSGGVAESDEDVQIGTAVLGAPGRRSIQNGKIDIGLGAQCPGECAKQVPVALQVGELSRVEFKAAGSRAPTADRPALGGPP